MDYLNNIGNNAKIASKECAKLSTLEKNNILIKVAEALIKNENYILNENKKDLLAAEAVGIKGAFLERLTLNTVRIKAIADAILNIASLNDPIGEINFMKTLENGLVVGQKRVPLGVICIIYESRPNVTADSFALCLKAGSSVILRGGKEALHSNIAFVSIFREVLKQNNMNENIVQLIENTDRELVQNLMKMKQYIDVLIPRGGAGLIKTVVENATIPVIETGVGNCHIFVDETADLSKATNIIINAKTQRPGVCNACEKLLIHENIALDYLPIIYNELCDKKVEVRGDEQSCKIVPNIIPATEADWSKEYEDYIISIKIVKNIGEAINHIEEYSTHHSDVILTENYSNAQRFLNEIDSAAVYVNASTRFTDGGEFGLGAEIGISTQKLHARGPMGLKEITTTKYIIYGNGQVRN